MRYIVVPAVRLLRPDFLDMRGSEVYPVKNIEAKADGLTPASPGQKRGAH